MDLVPWCAIRMKATQQNEILQPHSTRQSPQPSPTGGGISGLQKHLASENENRSFLLRACARQLLKAANGGGAACRYSGRTQP